MKDPRQLSIRDYSYFLPEEKIARYPLAERDSSRLLIYEKGVIREDHYRNLATHLPAGSLLIFNDTRVVEARLVFQKPTGGKVEIFCLEPHEEYADISRAMLQKGRVKWLCLIGGASKWKPGQLLEKQIPANGKFISLYARFLEKRADVFVIELKWTPAEYSFAELLHLAGLIPLPPYLKRDAESSDNERYQTVYAREEGSVAAPTAGLHFTKAIFDSLHEKQIATGYVTLHVGAGTFKPVKSETMAGHTMHAEWIDVNRGLIEQLLSHKGPVVAVGTTTLRTLESLYWLGKRLSPKTITIPEITQWEPYETKAGLSREEALQNLITWMDNRKTNRLLTRTQILIAPGYEFKMVKGLVTNFHQPESTLLLLVAAFIGKNWKEIYEYALSAGFRFLSYGDGCLLWRKEEADQDNLS